MAILFTPGSERRLKKSSYSAKFKNQLVQLNNFSSAHHIVLSIEDRVDVHCWLKPPHKCTQTSLTIDCPIVSCGHTLHKGEKGLVYHNGTHVYHHCDRMQRFVLCVILESKKHAVETNYSTSHCSCIIIHHSSSPQLLYNTCVH